jgi:hypothetical protein
MADPDDYCHLVVADTHPLPPLSEVTSYPEEILRRDVADEALCGWRLPHKYFSRILWSDEHEIPGWQGPRDICPDCLQAVVERRLQPGTLCLVPPGSWDNWDTE